MKRTIVITSPDEKPRAQAAWLVRSAISFFCALVADGLQWLIPPLWVVCDGAMVIALLLIWGRRWEIALAVVPEVIPGLDLFPTWTLFVGYLIVTRREPSALGGQASPPVIRREERNVTNSAASEEQRPDAER